MWFGALPSWAQELADGLPLSVWPQQVRASTLAWTQDVQQILDGNLHMQISDRQPNFDQMIVNAYEPGEGISSHVDLLKFEDGIAIVSLGSPSTMSFTKADTVADSVADPPADSVADFAPLTKEPLSCDAKPDKPRLNRQRYRSASTLRDSHPLESLQQNIHLQAGDVLLLHGEARYTWKHGIAFDQPCSLQSSERRVSITLRRLVRE